MLSIPHAQHNTHRYIIYTVWQPEGPPPTSTHMSVERLDAKDYLSSALEATLFTGPDASADEAPVLIKRKGVYYAMVCVASCWNPRLHTNTYRTCTHTQFLIVCTCWCVRHITHVY